MVWGSPPKGTGVASWPASTPGGSRRPLRAGGLVSSVPTSFFFVLYVLDYGDYYSHNDYHDHYDYDYCCHMNMVSYS